MNTRRVPELGRKLSENEAAVVRGSLLNRAMDERCPTKEIAEKLYDELYSEEGGLDIVFVSKREKNEQD